MRARTAAAISVAGMLVALLLALLPYRPTNPGTGLVDRCGPPVLAWRGEFAGVGVDAGTSASPVESSRECAGGVTRRLALALLVSVGGQVPLVVFALRRREP